MKEFDEYIDGELKKVAAEMARSVNVPYNTGYRHGLLNAQQQVKKCLIADVGGSFPFSEPEDLASWMHNTYEDVAVSEGWDTQDRCKVDFSELPNENKRTMIEVARRILELRE